MGIHGCTCTQMLAKFSYTNHCIYTGQLTIYSCTVQDSELRGLKVAAVYVATNIVNYVLLKART